MSAMSVGELFAGYGGISLALEALTLTRTAWVAETAAGPRKVLAHRFPDASNLGDVTCVDWGSVEPVDVIAGGSPCQDLSVAGQRAGMMPGTRSGLWGAMTHAIATIRPSLVVWENVRGALSASAFSLMESDPGRVGGGADGPSLRALGRVLGDLSSLGYDAQWITLPASDAGAPHRRERVFVLAHRQGAPADAARLISERIGEARDGRPGPADGGGQPVSLLPTPAVNDMGAAYTPETWDAWTAKMRARHGNGNGHGKSLNIEAQRMLPTPSVADATGGHARRGGDRSAEFLLPGAVRPENFGPYAAAVQRWEAVTGTTAPSPTEPGKNGNLRLSAAFAEWMMGLPAGWITDVPDVSRREAVTMCGNGVVPQQAALALSTLAGWAVAA